MKCGEMGKQCIAEKQNNSASGIGERVVDLITVRSHFFIWKFGYWGDAEGCTFSISSLGHL